MSLQDAKLRCDNAADAFNAADDICKQKRRELKALELEAARLRFEFIDSVQRLKDAQAMSKRDTIKQNGAA